MAVNGDPPARAEPASADTVAGGSLGPPRHGAAQLQTLAALAAGLEAASPGLGVGFALTAGGHALSEVRKPAVPVRRAALWSTPVRSARGALLGVFIAHRAVAQPLSDGARAGALRLLEAATSTARVAIEGDWRPDAGANYRAIVERIPAVVYVADAGSSGRWHYVSPQTTQILGFTPEECLADHDLWAKLLHPEDRDRVLAEEAAAVGGVPVTGPSDYRLLHRDGRVVWVRDDAVLVRDEQGRLRWHGVMSDITERKEAEAQLERRAAQQAAVARLGERALEGADLVRLMNEAVHEAVRILDMQMGGVLQLQPDERLLLRAGVGWPATDGPDTTVAAGERSQAGFSLLSGEAVVVSDWSREQRFDWSPSLREQNMLSGIATVIEGPGGPWGVLGVQCTRAREYASADVDFVQALANVLADAIHRRLTEDEIRHRALHDPLTGLPNRVLFLDRLEHALRQRRHRVAVLFLDLDNFKIVNDSLGHAAGDELLRAAAPRLCEALRPGDTVARFGGDEFGLLLEDIGSERVAAAVAERVASAFARPFVLEGSEHFVSASVGIALAGDGQRGADELIRDADAAMYRAKARGRARYELFDQDMRARAMARLSVENDLRGALERDELRVVYQPVISLRDGGIVSVEALVRWQHPQRGLLAPAQFVPVAEEVGLIEPIGRWVLGAACRQAAQWHRLRPDSAPLGISVNLSPRQVVQRDLVPMVAEAVRESGIQALSLSLEITETALLDEADSVVDTLAALRGMGVRLVLDDFGTGYSSLGHLTRLSIDGIKVDRCFVEGLGREPRASAVVAAVVGMAQALDIEATAEGVETEAQVTELRRLGCDSAQGFLFARPAAPESVGELLDRWVSPTWAPEARAGRGQPPSGRPPGR